MKPSMAGATPNVPSDPREWVWLRQVHGHDVVTVDAVPAEVPEADAAVDSAGAEKVANLTRSNTDKFQCRTGGHCRRRSDPGDRTDAVFKAV